MHIYVHMYVHITNDVFVILYLILQPVLLKMATGKHQNETLSQYISCPKFRARMKTMSFGCLVNHFSMEEVIYSSKLLYLNVASTILYCSTHAEATVVYYSKWLCLEDCKRSSTSTLTFFEQWWSLFWFRHGHSYSRGTALCVTCNQRCLMSDNGLQEWLRLPSFSIPFSLGDNPLPHESWWEHLWRCSKNILLLKDSGFPYNIFFQ